VAPQNVSSLPGLFPNPGRFDPVALLCCALYIQLLKRVQGAVLQDAKVIAVDTHLLADLILIALLENHPAQDAPVALGKLVDDPLHQFPGVAAHELLQRIGAGIGRTRGGILVLQRREPLAATVKLVPNVVADRIDEGAKLLRLADAAL